MCLLFFFYGNRLTALAFDFTPSHTWHTRANTHTQTHKESGRKVQCCPPSSFLWRCFFFLFPLSQTSWEGYSALCVQRHSFFIFTSFILSVSYSWGAMSKKRGWGWVFHLDKEGHRENSTTKVQGNREGKGEWKRKRRSLLVLRSSVLAAVWRRMAGGCLGVERVPV